MPRRVAPEGMKIEHEEQGRGRGRFSGQRGLKWPRLSRRAWLRLALFAAPVALVGDAFWLEPKWLKVRTLRLCQGRPAHRFVHFTDLHHKGNRALLESVVRKINGLKPDFVCFTGDIVEEARFVAEALAGLRRIKSPLYGVPGNHDYWAELDFRPVAEAFAATGGAWLMDRAQLIGDGRVNLLGATCMLPFTMLPKAGVKNIVLIHYPAWVTNLGAGPFDLILAGHSHGGQVRLPFIGPLVSPAGVDQYSLGLYQTTPGPLYVGAGIGWFYLNARFRCRPEVTLIEL
jgi:hypothetical protein